MDGHSKLHRSFHITTIPLRVPLGSIRTKCDISIIHQLTCGAGTISTTSRAVSHRAPLGSDRLIGSPTALCRSTFYGKTRVSNSYNRHRDINKAISYSGTVATLLHGM
jgi:hypothetical protein